MKIERINSKLIVAKKKRRTQKMNKIKTQKGITMIALVITVIILLILTNVLVYNAQDSVYI